MSKHQIEIMKEGSKTIYEMEATPYSSCRVVFVDKFGIREPEFIEMGMEIILRL